MLCRTWDRHLARAVLLLGLYAVLPALAAPPLVLTAPGDLPGRRARLGEEARLGVIIDETEGLIVPLELPPGRVSIEAVIRSNRRGDALRQRTVSLSVPGASSSQTVAALDRGVPLSVSFVNREARVQLRFGLGRMTAAMQNEMTRLIAEDEGIPESSVDGLDAAADDPLLDALALDMLADDVQDALERQVPIVLLEQLRIAPRSGPVIVRRVTSDRITYAPGVEGTLTVELENLAASEQHVELAVSMTEELTARTELGRETVILPAGARETFKTPFAVGDALWGRGFEVTAATEGGKDLGAHAVSVVDNPWMVALHGRGVPMFGSELWTDEQAVTEAESIAQANMENYANVYEKFAWAACDYSDMTPADDGTIHSGQTQYTSKRSAYQILHEVFSQHGIFSITYGKACGGGYAGTAWNEALILAGGARPMGGGNRALRRFATRFSQYILDPALRRLENPATVIQPVDDAGFRWDAFVYERAVSATRAQLILQLVNVSNDTVLGNQYTQPVNLNPPRRDLEFEVTPPHGYRITGVFATEDHETLAPMPARLEGARLHIPSVHMWNLVVLDLERDETASTVTGGAAQLDLAQIPDGSAWQEAAGLRPSPPAPPSRGSTTASDTFTRHEAGPDNENAA